MPLNNQIAIIVRTTVVIILSSFLATSCAQKPAAQRNDSTPSNDPPVARTLPPLPVRPLSGKLKALQAVAMRRASELRELTWKSEAGLVELSGWEYGLRTSEMAQSIGGQELRDLSRLAIAGGVLPDGTDLATLAASFAAVSASATYSPLDKQVLLVKSNSGNSLLIHEFVHALQDQHFDLLKLLIVRPYNYDRTEAVLAVVEGDAMNVQRRAEEGESYGQRSLADITQQENARFDEYRKTFGSLFPPLLTETFVFRYRDGARFVETVRRKSGQRGVDQLFWHPPVSSEQILHPEKYFAGEVPRAREMNVEAFAENNWRIVTSTSLGEIGVRGMLMAGVSDPVAMQAAEGWGGDRACVFERAGSAPLFVWKSEWDKRTDAEEFFKAYNAMTKMRKGVQPGDSFTNGSEVTMTWREGAILTVVRLVADRVTVIRGPEVDVPRALEIAGDD